MLTKLAPFPAPDHARDDSDANEPEDDSQGSGAPLLTSAPGFVNQVADALSRRFDPSRAEGWPLPSSLASATLTACPPRDSSFYVFEATAA